MSASKLNLEVVVDWDKLNADYIEFVTDCIEDYVTVQKVPDQKVYEEPESVTVNIKGSDCEGVVETWSDWYEELIETARAAERNKLTPYQQWAVEQFAELGERYVYIAVDESGSAWAYDTIPTKKNTVWDTDGEKDDSLYIGLYEDNVIWENSLLKRSDLS